MLEWHFDFNPVQSLFNLLEGAGNMAEKSTRPWSLLRIVEDHFIDLHVQGQKFNVWGDSGVHFTLAEMDNGFEFRIVDIFLSTVCSLLLRWVLDGQEDATCVLSTLLFYHILDNI